MKQRKRPSSIFHLRLQTSTIVSIDNFIVNFYLLQLPPACSRRQSTSIVAQNKFAGKLSLPCRLRGRACGVDNLFPCCSSEINPGSAAFVVGGVLCLTADLD